LLATSRWNPNAGRIGAFLEPQIGPATTSINQTPRLETRRGAMKQLPLFRGQDLRFIALPIGRHAALTSDAHSCWSSGRNPAGMDIKAGLAGLRDRV